jgi:hypothetical protein
VRSAPWQIVAAAIALSVSTSACNNRPPLGPPRVDAGRDVAAEVRADVVVPPVCGGDAQPCCETGCNLGLACDRPAGDAVGTCTSRCGHQDDLCCRGGGCASGTACDGPDGTGVCRPCGVPGLTCCRADCWIGVCLTENTPRTCAPCGLIGQLCCANYTGARCEEGARCDPSSGGIHGTCVPGS